MRVRRAVAQALVAALAGSLLATLPAPLAAAEEVYYRPSDGVFHIEGHGWGHGHGLNQWGAEGAARTGVTATTILNHYYPGTAQTTQASRLIRVFIQDDDHTDLRVRAVSGLKVRDRATNAVYTLPSGPAQWRIVQTSGGQKVQQYTGSWTTWGTGGKTAWTGPMQFEGVTPIRVYFANGSAREYRGILRAVRTGTSTIDVVNVLNLEHYLYGVVPRESPASFKPEALKAQSVAARSYSTYKMDHAPSGAHYDICSTIQCQVYGGVRLFSGGTTYELEHANTTNAVNATKGVVRTYGGKAIFAEFSSSNGGWSTQGAFSYLSPRSDPWDKIASPHHHWTATLTAGQLEARFPSIGTFRRMRITKRDGNGEWGGRVKEVVVEGSSGSVTTTGGTIYAIETWPASSTGMRGTWFHIKPSLAASLVAKGSTPTLVRPPGASTGVLAVHLRNQGTVAWNASTVHLAVASPAGAADPLAGGSTRPGVFVRNISRSGATTVEPGEAARFEVRLSTGSVSPGTYSKSYRLRVGSGALFGPTVSWTVTVQAPVFTSGYHSIRGTVAPVGDAPPAVWRDGTVVIPRTGSTTAHVLIRNTGNLNWPLNSTVVLNTSNPRGRASQSAASSWQSSSVPSPVIGVDGVPGATAVKPGQVGIFPVKVFGNGHPAGLTFETFEVRWQGYAWVVGAKPTLKVVRYDPAVSRNAELVSQPATMTVLAYPGGRRTLRIRLRNIGGTPWPVNGGEVIATSNGRQDALRTSAWLEPTRATRLAVNVNRPAMTSVYPGETAEYRIPIDPTNKPAQTYGEFFRALDTSTGRRYGPAAGAYVTVKAATLAASIGRNTSGIAVPRAGTATYSVDLKNTGNTTWNVGREMRLTSSSSPSYHSSWLHSRRPTAIDRNVTRPGATVVYPGEVARFTFTIAGNGRAPGRYTETFGALWEGWRSTDLRIPIAYVIV